MIIVGFLIFAVAVAAAIVAIVQNRTAMVHVNGLGYSWDVHVYWVLVAGLVIAAVGFIGIAMMRAGAVHASRLRMERRGLKRENARLSDAVSERSVETAPAAPVVQAAPVAPAAPVAQPVAPVAQPVVAPTPAMAGSVNRDASSGVYETADSVPRHRSLFHRTGHGVSDD
jgi:hypothetical protein